ncbi:MAG: thioredoxin [Alphaproteobacteria bacterium]|nr:thioredoxin [Alphaproteobacteria bacterium]MBP7758010.1 thioredoxin [Alphaproteobacteria bacterium]MBP7761337.1 thioredoxin [Alphaproteobacteria bacterium]MBP7904879.1 thioredoxin [Alphaproteobacteria bacterium]
MSLQSVTDKDFAKEVVESEQPVLVDFWAEWCAPCQRFLPIVEEVAGEMAGKVKIVKMNIEESPETPTKYGVKGIPTIMLFKGGKLVDTRMSGMPKSQLVAWLENHV